MILYFSGTGNSEYAARRIGQLIGDETVNLFDRLRKQDFSGIHSDRPWVIVSPTYAWRVPRILQEWMEKTRLSGSREIYFVMTCGGSIGNAGKYLEKFCKDRGLRFQGCLEVVMPENYIALFSTPAKEDALKIVEQAEAFIEKAAGRIKEGKRFPKHPVTWKDRFSSGPVNMVFYPVFVHAGKFYAEDTCVSCGKCETVCPMNNIHMQNGKPVWGTKCTHCMACICRCPKEAIEYGKHSKGLPRYTCPK